MSGKVFVRKRALPGRNFVRSGLPGRNFVRKGLEAGSARKEFYQERFCQEAGSAKKEFCQEGFFSGSGLCQEGGVSFAVGCETVRRRRRRRRRRRLFLFWGGRGASQLWSLV